MAVTPIQDFYVRYKKRAKIVEAKGNEEQKAQLKDLKEKIKNIPGGHKAWQTTTESDMRKFLENVEKIEEKDSTTATGGKQNTSKKTTKKTTSAKASTKPNSSTAKKETTPAKTATTKTTKSPEELIPIDDFYAQYRPRVDIIRERGTPEQKKQLENLINKIEEIPNGHKTWQGTTRSDLQEFIRNANNAKTRGRTISKTDGNQSTSQTTPAKTTSTTAKKETAPAKSASSTPKKETTPAKTATTKTTKSPAKTATATVEKAQKETAKKETPKAETKKTETPKATVAKPSAKTKAKTSTSKTEKAQQETKKTDTPKPTQTKTNQKTTETPKTETPKTETPKGETPKTKTTTGETPKGKTPKTKQTKAPETSDTKTPEGKTPKTPEGKTPKTPEGKTPKTPEGKTPKNTKTPKTPADTKTQTPKDAEAAKQVAEADKKLSKVSKTLDKSVTPVLTGAATNIGVNAVVELISKVDDIVKAKPEDRGLLIADVAGNSIIGGTAATLGSNLLAKIADAFPGKYKAVAKATMAAIGMVAGSAVGRAGWSKAKEALNMETTLDKENKAKSPMSTNDISDVLSSTSNAPVSTTPTMSRDAMLTKAYIEKNLGGDISNIFGIADPSIVNGGLNSSSGTNFGTTTGTNNVSSVEIPGFGTVSTTGRTNTQSPYYYFTDWNKWNNSQRDQLFKSLNVNGGYDKGIDRNMEAVKNAQRLAGQIGQGRSKMLRRGGVAPARARQSVNNQLARYTREPRKNIRVTVGPMYRPDKVPSSVIVKSGQGYYRIIKKPTIRNR